MTDDYIPPNMFRFFVGQHKGKKFDDPSVPISYLRWYEINIDISPLKRKGLNFEIKRRKGQITSQGRVVKKARNE